MLIDVGVGVQRDHLEAGSRGRLRRGARRHSHDQDTARDYSIPKSLSRGLRRDHIEMVEHCAGRLADTERLDECRRASTSKPVSQ